MKQIEYKVVPAPTKAKRGRWIRNSSVRFADHLQYVLNDMAKDGWEYVRTDTLPCEQRVGLTQTTTTYQNMLVFKRTADETTSIEDLAQKLAMLPSPEQFAPIPEPQSLISKAPIDLDLMENNQVATPTANKHVSDAVLSDAPSSPAWVHHDNMVEDIDGEIVEELSPALLSRLKQVKSEPDTVQE